MLATGPILITEPVIAILCNSTVLATGELTPTSRAGVADSTCMNAPVLFWAGTVARTHGAVTFTCAWAAALTEAKKTAIRNRVFMNRL